jgi:DNA-binding response OmpR family regulator
MPVYGMVPSELTLQPKDSTFLQYLVLHPNRLLPKAELLQAVWAEAYVTDEVLKGCIKRLRSPLFFKLARLRAEIELQMHEDKVPAIGVMRLAE